MRKRVLSLCTVLALCLAPVSTLAKRVETPAPPDGSEQLVISENLGPFTTRDVNPYTPVTPRNGFADIGGKAYDPFAEDDTSAAPEGNYVEGEILFAREGGASLFDAEDELEALGVTDAEPVFTLAASARLMGADDGPVWYKGKVSGSVPATAAALREAPGIVYAEPNYLYEPAFVGQPTEAETGQSWHMSGDAMNLPSGWDTAYAMNGKAPGADAVVAVIDSGVDYTHPDLAESMWRNEGEIPGNNIDDDGNGIIDDYYGYNATATSWDGAIQGDPMDYNGHGTHVSGIIAMAHNGEGGVGVAYGAKIMAIKSGQSTGLLSSEAVARGIEYAVAMGADVINMSFGGETKSMLVAEALQAAFTDCVLVASAGNDCQPTTDSDQDPSEDIYPAGYPYVLGVMATDEDGSLAGYSNWDYMANANCEYEVAAPGSNITSTVPGGGYATWNGTSMAAPMVSAAAAILRSCFPDKSEYNSRFIMGQLASASGLTVNVRSELSSITRVYPRLDLNGALTKLPKPELSVYEVFAMDNKREGTSNDGDRVLDAGEIIDLGFSIRNRWGRTGKITVRAESAVNGIPNPYVTFLTDTVTLEPAGYFATVNNGWVYNDGYLEDVSNPIRFKLAENTPNDTLISMSLIITTTNGMDNSDTTQYAFGHNEYPCKWRVMRGTGIQGHVSEDTTLTADKYWIIENTLSVDEGVTLTVEPGTQIQFGAPDSKDVYGSDVSPSIRGNGTASLIGTEDAPIQIFAQLGYNSNIRLSAFLQYCEIDVPYLYVTDLDHCDLAFDSEDRREIDPVLTAISADTITNCRFRNLYLSDFNSSSTCDMRRNLFDNVASSTHSGYPENSVLLTRGGAGKSDGSYSDSYWIDGRYRRSIPDNLSFSKPFTYDGAASKYVIAIGEFNFRKSHEIMRAAAESAGGTLLCFNSVDEETAFANAFWENIQNQYEINYLRCGFCHDLERNEWFWEDGATYIPSTGVHNDHHEDEEEAIISVTEQSYGQSYLRLITSYWSYSETAKTYSTPLLYFALEFPAQLSDEAILNALNAFDYTSAAKERIGSPFYHCAVLNPILNTNPRTWNTFSVYGYVKDYFTRLSGIYWGTENTALIDRMIEDDKDRPGEYAVVDYQPILTLNSPELAEIYPFVTRVWLTEPGGTQEITDAAPGKTYEVHVSYNRDMDASEDPIVTYGGEDPFTDYGVKGSWKSKREWVGTTKISTVTNGGAMIFRVSGARAADDHWLVCGTDQLRFQFNVDASSAQSVSLQATGVRGGVELRWVQTDYDLLAGYNLYRATRPTGEEEARYEKINGAIVTGNSFTDTAAEAGVTYQYYFALVDTDGNELPDVRSNVATATALDGAPPEISHEPPVFGTAGQLVSISATASDNVGVSSMTLYYRSGSAGNFTSVNMGYLSATGRYTGRIPAEAVTASGVEYYLEASDAAGNKGYFGSAEHPLRINIDVAIKAVTPNGANVQASVACGVSSASVYCAVYNSDGKMLAAKVKPVTGAETYDFAFDGVSFDYAKVFLLHADLSPLCEAGHS